jgi:hypothetical protein
MSSLITSSSTGLMMGKATSRSLMWFSATLTLRINSKTTSQFERLMRRVTRCGEVQKRKQEAEYRRRQTRIRSDWWSVVRFRNSKPMLTAMCSAYSLSGAETFSSSKAPKRWPRKASAQNKRFSPGISATLDLPPKAYWSGCISRNGAKLWRTR